MLRMHKIIAQALVRSAYVVARFIGQECRDVQDGRYDKSGI